MNSELWQECFCGTEPVCADCEKCESHCRCKQIAKDQREIQEFEKQNPGFLDKLNRHYEDGGREN